MRHSLATLRFHFRNSAPIKEMLQIHNATSPKFTTLSKLAPRLRLRLDDFQKILSNHADALPNLNPQITMIHKVGYIK
jgi:hypothetical protein